MDTSRPPAAGPSSVFSFHRKPRPSEANSSSNNTNAREAREAIIREAKRHVREVVRSDWVFEPSDPNPHSSPYLASPSPSSAAAAAAPADPHPHPVEVLEWRLREYDSSGSGSELEPQAGPASDHELENLDAVRASAVEIRRRRRRQLEDEMRWNPGLRTWVERRDAWSGAKKWREIQRSSSSARESKEGVEEQPEKKHRHERIISSSDSAGSRISAAEADAIARGSGPEPSSPSSSTNLAALSISEPREKKAGKLPAGSPPSPPESTPAAATAAAEEKLTQEEAEEDGLPAPPAAPGGPDPDDTLIPVVPPLLPPTNPIRASITPAVYPSLYSKVVVQGIAPTVPINLSDMIKAIVEGWKSDGQWPPKPTPVAPGDDIVVRKKGSSACAVNGNGNGHVNNNGVNNDNNINDNEKEKDKARRRSSSGHHHHHHHHHHHSLGSGVTGAVKKVLGLSGLHSHHHGNGHGHGHGHHHHHHFHLRGCPDGEADGGAGGGRRASGAAGAGGAAGADVPVVEDARDVTIV